jgi:hypothetical protein
MPEGKEIFAYCCQCDNLYGEGNLYLTTRCLNCEHDYCGGCTYDKGDGKIDGPGTHFRDYTSTTTIPENRTSKTKQDTPKPRSMDQRQVDLRAILDPVTHFSSLGDLETRVVQKCGISLYTLSNEVVNAAFPFENIITETIADYLENIIAAFDMLQESGFCSSCYTILVQDIDRYNVASAFTITRNLLETLCYAAHSTKRSTTIGDIAAKDNDAETETASRSIQQPAASLEELLRDLDIISINGTESLAL